MNKKIEELAEQAGADFTVPVFHSSDKANQLLNFDMTTFAELLITECYNICVDNLIDENTLTFDVTYNDGVMDCAILIKKNFGIECREVKR